MIYNIWSWKKGKYLQLKACSAKSLSSIPMAILLPPDDMALVENALYLDSRHTVHYLVFLIVIRVQSSMKCIICFVLGSSGEFKTRSGVTLILGWVGVFLKISQVQFIIWHCVKNLFSNLTTKYIYMPFVI